MLDGLDIHGDGFFFRMVLLSGRCTVVCFAFFSLCFGTVVTTLMVDGARDLRPRLCPLEIFRVDLAARTRVRHRALVLFGIGLSEGVARQKSSLFIFSLGL